MPCLAYSKSISFFLDVTVAFLHGKADFLRFLQKRIQFNLFELTPPRLLLYLANVSLIYVLFLGWKPNFEMMTILNKEQHYVR